MPRLIALLLVVLACANCHANEETEKRAADFLASQKDINTSLCGQTNYRVLLGAALLGSSSLKVEAAKFDDKPCYKVTWHINLKSGSRSYAGQQISYITAGMVCLHSAHSNHDSEDGDTTYTLTRADQRYVSVKTNEDSSAKAITFDDKERLALEAAEDLIPMLLQLDKLAIYDFQDHSGKWGYTGRTYEVVGPSEYGRLKGTLIKHLYYSANDKKNELQTNRTEVLVDSAHRILRLENKRTSMIVEVDDGDNSPDTYRQYARPIDPVLAFWNGIVSKDVKLMAECLNEERFLDETWDHDADNANMTKVERDLAKKRSKGKIPEAMLKNVQISEREKALFRSLTSEDFDLKFEHSTRVKIKLNDHYRKRSGDESEMYFVVEFDDDSGQWKFVWLNTNDDEF